MFSKELPLRKHRCSHTKPYQRFVIWVVCIYVKNCICVKKYKNSHSSVIVPIPVCCYWNCVEFCLKSTEDEESAPTRDVSRHFEDTSYGYKDFSRHGMHVPTFRAQVSRMKLLAGRFKCSLLAVPHSRPRNCCAVVYSLVGEKASEWTKPLQLTALR